MKITAIIATLERIVRLERGLAAKQAAVKEAEAASDGGYKAKEAVAAAKNALHQQTAEIALLQEGLPPVERDGLAWLIRTVAEARVDRAALQKDQAKAEATLKVAQETAKSSAWKFKGNPMQQTETKDVVAARTMIKEIAAKLEELNKRVKPLAEMLEEEIDREEDMAELAAWRARGYTDPMPPSILAAEEERRREFEAECVTIKIPRTKEQWAAWAAERAARDKAAAVAEVPEIEESWDSAGDSMLARILAGDFSAYFTKPAEVKVEEAVEVKVAPAVRRKAGKGTSSVEWMQRIIAAKKVKAAQMAAS